MTALTPSQMLLATSPWPSSKTVSYKIIDKDGTVIQDWTSYGVTERQIDATAALSIYQVVTIGEGMDDFVALSQTYRQYVAMTAAPSGNIYACVYTGGDIYKRTAGAGAFVALGEAARDWRGMAAAPNGNIYACVFAGDIYMQTAEAGAFNALAQTTRNWLAMAAAPNGDIYAIADGDIYKRTGGAGDFIALGLPTKSWNGITVNSNDDVYACVFEGDIYKQDAGAGDFIALGETSRDWNAMATSPTDNVYACDRDAGDIYIQRGSVGPFVALNQTGSGWWGMAAAPNGDVYACVVNEDIYIQHFGIVGGLAGFSGHVFWKTTDATPLIQSQTLNIEGDVCALLTRLSDTRATSLDNLTDRLISPVITSLTACAGTLPSGTYKYTVTAFNEAGETSASNEMSVVTEQVATPVNEAFTDGSGTLAPGTYYYRVVAINAVGQTLASTETSHVLAGVGGVNVNWGATSGATGYKIYGRDTGAELLMDTVSAVTTWLDDGSITPSGALPSENTTNGVQVNWDYPTAGIPTGFKLYGREVGNYGFLNTIIVPPTITSRKDNGDWTPNTSLLPPSINDSGLESISFEIINKSDAIKTKTDQITFDGNGRLESVIEYPEGYVIYTDLNSPIYFATSLTEAATGYWQGYISFTSGNLIGQTRKIELYYGSDNFVKMMSAFTGTPANGDTFVIVNK